MKTKQKQRYLKLKYSDALEEVWSMVWIRSLCLCFAWRNSETQLLGEDDCHPALYSLAKNESSLTCTDC